MKIIIVTPYFYPHIGGVEAYTLNIARQLKASGWKVVIVTTKYSPELSDLGKFEGMKVYRLPVSLKISNTPVGFLWRSKLRKIFEAEKPDVINGHSPVPYLADMAERVRGSTPFVLTYHNDVGKDELLYKFINKLTQTFIIKPTLKNSQKIIATSEYYVRHSKHLKNYKQKVSIVPPGVDISMFKPASTNKELTKKYANKKLILFVGSLNKTQMHKGVDTLILAFKQIRKEVDNAKLIIIGDGDAVPMYKKMADATGHGEDIEFTGFVGNDQLAQYYKMADVLVMASKNNNEGFGMVFIEAGAAGTPVVGTKVGGIPYAIKDHETGLIVKPNSVASIENAIVKLLSNKQLAKKLGQAGAHRAAKEFNWSSLAAKTSNIFEDAVHPTIIQVAGFYPPHLGGMEKVAQILSRNLADRHYEVQVLTTSIGAKPGSVVERQNLLIRRFKSFEFAHIPFAPGFLFALFRVPKKSVIHLHLAQAFFPETVFLVSKIRKIPYIVHFHLDLQPSGVFGKLFLIYKAVVLRTVIRHANKVVVFSDDQKQFIHDKYHVDFTDIALIPNGVSEEYFKKPHQLKKQRTYDLVYVGRLNSQKRVHILIEMMSFIKTSAKLSIIGDGEERLHLEGLVNMLNLKNVKFVGQVDPHEISHYYTAAEAMVISSENEGMPLAVLEAMAAGLPIVGSDVPGIKELVKGVGILVEKPTGKAFAKAIDKLFSDVRTYDALAMKSVESARSYSWANATNAFEELYQRVET